MRKKCKSCGAFLQTTDFHRDSSKSDGLKSSCRKCRGVKTAQKNPHDSWKDPAVTKDYYKYYRIWKAYGLTKDDYESILATQNNMCPVCSRSFTDVKPVVDHCHTTNVIRGILCTHCNIALGHIFDNPVTAINLAKYLRATMEANYD